VEVELTSEYLGSQHQWDWIADELASACKQGIATATDAETLGCDPEFQTPVSTARVIIWSVGISDGVLVPRGYHKARGYVLPWQAAFHGKLQEWLRGLFGRVWTFNGRYDRHAFANLGVDTSGLVDALDYLRILDPGQDSYSLKSCIPRYLGYNPVGKFKDVFSEPQSKTVTKKLKICSWDKTHDIGGKARKYCECCKALVETLVWEEEKRLPNRKVGMAEACGLTYDMRITPGESSIWPDVQLYSAVDSIGTAEIGDFLPTFSSCKLPAKIPQI
jgi:hypothetical protein